MIADAVATLAPFPSLPEAKWSTDPIEDNVSSDSELSAALVTLEGATISSPIHVLLFHRGKFLGTATDQAIPGVQLLDNASTSTEVAIAFKELGTPHAGQPTWTGTATFRWLDSRVYRSGELPYGITSSFPRRGDGK